MMDSAPSDAATDDVSAEVSRARLIEPDNRGGVLRRITSKWWLIPVLMLVAALGAGIYLLLAKPTYSVVAILAAERSRPASATDLPMAEYLASQRALILAHDVLSTGNVTSDAVEVRTDKGEGTITISLDASQPSRGVLSLNAIVDAYMKSYERQQASAVHGVTDLSAARDAAAADRATKEKALLAVRARTAASTDAEKASASHLAQLSQALASAQTDSANASAELATLDAAKEKPEQLLALINAARPTGIFSTLDDQRATAKKELDQLEPLYARQKASLLPQHPALRETQRRIDVLNKRILDIDSQYAPLYRAQLEKKKSDATNKVSEFQTLVDSERRKTNSPADDATATQLEAALKQSDEALAAADQKLKDALAGGDSSGITVKLVQPPTAPSHPSHPQPLPVMMTALAIGLLAGLALALATGRSR